VTLKFQLIKSYNQLKIDISNAISKINRISIPQIILFCLLLNFFSSWYFQQIRGVNFGTSMGFFYLDTNCSNYHLSKVNHCFGDFQIFLRSNILSDDIQRATELYPPASHILFYPFSLLNQYFSIATFSYLLLAMFLNIFGSHLLLTINRLRSNLFIWIVLNFSTLPLLVAFERGNSIIFVPFLVTLLLTGLLTRNTKYISVSILLLLLVKPHYVLLLFVLLAMNKFRIFINILCTYIFLNLIASYMLYSNPFIFISKFLSSYGTLNAAQNISELWPINISPLHTIAKIGTKFGFIPNSFVYLLVSLSIFVLFIFYVRSELTSKIDEKTISIQLFVIFVTLCFTYVLYSHSPVYYLLFAYVFLYMYEFSLPLVGNLYFNFLFKLNLIFMTFYFPIFRSEALLTRFGDEIKIFLIYNSYVLLFLNSVLLTSFVILIRNARIKINK
jgi:hypothetical protein